MTTAYQFDPAGTLPANRITGEQHVITAISGRNYHFIVPTYAPFFSEGCAVLFKDIDNNIRYLVEGIDYLFCFQFIAASRSCAKPIYGGISFLNLELAGIVTLVYQTVGGSWTLDPIKINEILSDTVRNPRITRWEHVAGVPSLFPVVEHEWNLTDLVGMSDVVDKVDEVAQAIANRPVAPSVIDYTVLPTKEMLGLGKVNNFGVATDAEAQAGTSITKYMTPRAVRVAVQYVLDTMSDAMATLTALAARTGASLVGTATNQTLDQAVLRVKTLDELRILPVPSSDPSKLHTVLVLGNEAVGDIVSCSYYWDVSNQELDNDYTVIKPLSVAGAGRWISEDKGAYRTYSFTATPNQSTYVLDNAPLPGASIKIVINKFVEFVVGVDFQVNANVVRFTQPIEQNQTVDIVIQVKHIKINKNANSMYQSFNVVSQNDVFLLSENPADPSAYCLRLNDALILFNGVDITVAGNQLTVSYPIISGDVLEFMPQFHPSGLPTFVLRQLLDH